MESADSSRQALPGARAEIQTRLTLPPPDPNAIAIHPHARSGMPRQAFPGAGGECRIGPHRGTRTPSPDRSIASPVRRSATSLPQRRRGMPERASPPNKTSTTRPQHHKPGPAFRDKPFPAQEGNAGSGLTTEQDLDHQTAASQARSGVPRQAFPSVGGECRIGPHRRTRTPPPDRSIASPVRRSAKSLPRRQ
jgi:hypothetical protein